MEIVLFLVGAYVHSISELHILIIIKIVFGYCPVHH